MGLISSVWSTHCADYRHEGYKEFFEMRKRDEQKRWKREGKNRRGGIEREEEERRKQAASPPAR